MEQEFSKLTIDSSIISSEFLCLNFEKDKKRYIVRTDRVTALMTEFISGFFEEEINKNHSEHFKTNYFDGFNHIGTYDWKVLKDWVDQIQPEDIVQNCVNCNGNGKSECSTCEGYAKVYCEWISETENSDGEAIKKSVL